jgi:virginiamycin B lyase
MMFLVYCASPGELGKLNTSTGKTHHISLGQGSAPHGVIVGPDGAPWITDGGLNAIVRVDPITKVVKTFPLPDGHSPIANLNTATFEKKGTLWFTGQSGIYGRLYPSTGQMEILKHPMILVIWHSCNPKCNCIFCIACRNL